MTPIQTFGATPAPSNMQFPTAAYLQAAANAADLRTKGMDAIARGIAGGIEKASNLMEAHKEEQAKYNATKKMFDAFSGYLDESQKENIKNIFADTTMSVKEKNALAPILMQFLAASQQQAGRESLAKIMNQGKVDVAGTRRPTPMTGTSFGGIPTLNSVFDTPLNQVQQQDQYQLPSNPSQGNPAPLIRSGSSGMPETRVNPETGKMEFWSPEAERYVEDLYFDPNTLGLEK